MTATVPVSTKQRTGLVVVYLAVLSALIVREYLVNIRPHDLQFALQQHLLWYWKYSAMIAVLLGGVFTATVLLEPFCTRGLEGLSQRWHRSWTVMLLVAVEIALGAAMYLLSNRQYGAYDQSVIVDTLWRQGLGQLAYQDFLTTNPPLFVLGLRFAAAAFGVTWNAQAWLLCLFSAITFPWCYLLLRRLDLRRRYALLLAVSTQVSALLVLSFWWYNNITSVIAGLFLLSSLVLIGRAQSRFAQVSYVLSLTLLTWVKPNSAGLMGLGCFLVLVLLTPMRIRLVGLSGLALTLSVAVLALARISPVAILSSYASVARTRGLVFPALHINPFFTAEAYFEFACLALVLALVLPSIWRAVALRDRMCLARWLVLLVGGAVGIFGVAANGDLVDVGLAPVVLAVGVAAFGKPYPRQSFVALFYTALFAALLCTQTYKGVCRLRIRVTGPYFETAALTVPVRIPFFRDLQTGDAMNRIDAEIGNVLQHDPGPVFFTSRLEWAYAAFHLQSPEGLPVYYDPGTSFALTDEPKLLQRWRSLGFNTVVQPARLSNGLQDWIGFPRSFQETLANEYDRDATTYGDIIVWHRKSAPAQKQVLVR